MSRKYRVIFLAIFAVFFVITTPFLVLYSLGYDLNFEQGELSNSISIVVDSRPRTSDVLTRDQVVLRNNGELRANDQQLIPIGIQQENFHAENFLIWSGDGENTTARLSPVWLLPTEYAQIEDDNSVQFISLLSKDEAIIKIDNEYFVQLYSFSGLQSAPEPIINSAPTLISINDGIQWDSITENVYWSKNSELFLIRSGNRWNLFDSRTFISKPEYVAFVNSSELLLLDSNQTLWVWNHELNTFRFIESGFDAMSYTQIPNNIWLYRYDTIYRINTNQISDQIQFEDTIFTTSNALVDFDNKPNIFFEVENVYQGIYIHIENLLLYIPDYNQNDVIIISDNARKVFGEDDSIIWLDELEQVWVYNLDLKQLQNVTTIPELDNFEREDIDIFYYSLWKRILVYTPNTVDGVWYNKDLLNNSIVGYTPIKWVENHQCHEEMIDRYQFCIDNQKLVAYRNTSFW